MPTPNMKIPGYRLMTLGVLVAVSFALYAVNPRGSRAQSQYCAEEVYEYCFAQNRPVDPNTCECIQSACLMPIATDCTEVGGYLDPSRCICVENPAYVDYCANDPFLLGCPRAFDTIFGDLLRIGGSPYSGGGDPDPCSYSAYVWCNQNNGQWYSQGCACSFTSSTPPSTACTNLGGTWVNNGNQGGGAVCYNPSGYGPSNCSSSSGSLSSCISSNGRWNPFTCTCSTP